MRNKRLTPEEALEECEHRLRLNRMPLKELRREMKQAKGYLGKVDWELMEKEDA